MNQWKYLKESTTMKRYHRFPSFFLALDDWISVEEKR